MANAARSIGAVPQETDELAKPAIARLAQLIHSGRPLGLGAADGNDERPVELPAAAAKHLLEIVEHITAGRTVAVIAQDAELTTQEAADLLNVSRPFLIQLLHDRKIPCRKVGSHRRIRFEDVRRYKEAIDAERRKVLDELVAEAQELDMGY